MFGFAEGAGRPVVCCSLLQCVAVCCSVKLTFENMYQVFTFDEGAGRPVVHKTAFFDGFGWVLCLQDGSMW